MPTIEAPSENTTPEDWFSKFLPLLEATPIAIASLRDLVSTGCNPMLLSILLYLACRKNPQMETQRKRRRKALRLTSEVLSAIKVTVANLKEIAEVLEDPDDAMLPRLTQQFSDLARVIELCLEREIPQVPGSSTRSVRLSLGNSEVEFNYEPRLDPSKRGSLRPALQSAPLFEYLRRVAKGPRLKEMEHLLRLGQKAAGGGVDGVELIYKRHERYVKQFPTHAELPQLIIRRVASRYEKTVPSAEEAKIEAELLRILGKTNGLNAEKGTSAGAAAAGNASAAVMS